MIPENINRNHLLKAIEDINSNGINKGRHSSTYDLIYEGERYPPKLIISLANKYANGEELNPDDFYGGLNTPSFKLFEKEGFDIIPKKQMFFIEVSKNYKDNNGDLLKAKLIICKNGYKLLKGSFIFKEPKTSFLDHPYYKMRIDFESKNFFVNSKYTGYLKLIKDIQFDAPSPAAVIVLNRAANGKTEWKLNNGITLEEYENKISFSDIIQKFLEQAKTDNLKTKHYIKSYKKTKVKVSFGQGNTAKIPWISFLKEPFITSDGIYPVYLYYKNINKLILAYGRSVTNKPKLEWNIDKVQSILRYFEENNFQKPEKYGDSHVFKVYDVNNLPDDKILNDDLDEIIEKYSSMGNNEFKPEKNIASMKFDLENFEENCKSSGLTYNSQLITRYISSLATKPFVLLSGLSGSGKTKLAQAFAQWICESEEQYCIVPVGADWTNREPLLGYVNALTPTEYILPENGALELIINANNNQEKPYFLILDEMNLSHVERYFADFLSVMESEDKFKLHSSSNPLDGSNNIKVENKYDWPKNLFIVGTVNIDETTYMFSPKVLDRANVIEFRVSETEMSNFFKSSIPLDLNKLVGEDDIPLGAKYGESFVDIAKEKTNSTSDKLTKTLNAFFTSLKKVGAEFGYRTASEIQTLFGQIDKIRPEKTPLESEKIDFAIMQKLLPKLHGSRNKLVPVLSALAILCYGIGEDNKLSKEDKKDIFKKREELKGKIIYPISLEKIERMYDNVIANGFTSYAEA
jgi:5-methylcytosine-specific restriction protein B